MLSAANHHALDESAKKSMKQVADILAPIGGLKYHRDF
jgi:hypothetical protein